MKLISDLLAIILFFATYAFTKNMMWATGVAVMVSILQTVYMWLKYRKLEVMQWLSFILVVGMGGATILLKDPRFFMLKTTVLFWGMALLLLGMELAGKSGLQLLLGKELKLPQVMWKQLTYTWIIFFLFMGALNFFIAYPFTPEREAFWVKFKLYGYLPLTLLFSIVQGIYIYRQTSKHQALDEEMK